MPYICPVCGSSFQTRTFCNNCGRSKSECQCREPDFYENEALLEEVEDDDAEDGEDDGDDIEEESDEEDDDDY